MISTRHVAAAAFLALCVLAVREGPPAARAGEEPAAAPAEAAPAPEGAAPEAAPSASPQTPPGTPPQATAAEPGNASPPPPHISASPPPEMARPPYVTALQEGRDLILNRQYDAGRKLFSEYGAAHPDDPIEAFGLALVEVTSQLEAGDFDGAARLDPVFENARIAADAWREKNPKSSFARWILGAAEGIQAMWWFKTGSTFRGIPRALSAVGNVGAVAEGKNPDPDARGGWGIYLYMRGKYKPFFLPFLDSRKEGRHLLEDCRSDAGVMGPLCHLFLLQVARWEGRWDDLDKLATAFRSRYPGSPFAAHLQAEARLVLKNPQGALSVLREYARTDKDSAVLYYWLGRVFWDGLQQARPAQQAWDKAIEKGLQNEKKACDAQAGLGEIAIAEGLLAEAELRFGWATRLYGKCHRAGQGRGKLAEAKAKAKTP